MGGMSSAKFVPMQEAYPGLLGAEWRLGYCEQGHIRVSSANSLSVEHIPFPMSFINSRKQRGTRTVPWGTPDLTTVLRLFFSFQEYLLSSIC